MTYIDPGRRPDRPPHKTRYTVGMSKPRLTERDRANIAAARAAIIEAAWEDGEAIRLIGPTGQTAYITDAQGNPRKYPHREAARRSLHRINPALPSYTAASIK